MVDRSLARGLKVNAWLYDFKRDDTSRKTCQESKENRDTILEFGNATSPEYHILRFRVLSHPLAIASPLFTHIRSTVSRPLN
jgi:hypothetical protein